MKKNSEKNNGKDHVKMTKKTDGHNYGNRGM